MDYFKVNKVTHKDSYPLPRIDERLMEQVLVGLPASAALVYLESDDILIPGRSFQQQISNLCELNVKCLAKP